MTHLALMTFLVVSPGTDAPKGKLVAVGGGGTTSEIVRKTVDLAGGASARMLIVPQSSSDPAASGKSSAEFWGQSGVKSIEVLKADDPKAAIEQIKAADLIWMPGGDQNRLTRAFAGTGIPEAIRERYRAGAVVGGTSAGAAVLSSAMIVGGDQADLNEIRPGGTKIAEGLGLWPTVIVDQHFSKRQRFIRLLSAVLDRPELVGIGVDEATAALFSSGKLEVVGKSHVMVFDARRARREAGRLAATDIRLHVLMPGMTFDLSELPR